MTAVFYGYGMESGVAARGSRPVQGSERRAALETTGHTLTVFRFDELRTNSSRSRIDNPANWKPVEGVRREVEQTFMALEFLNCEHRLRALKAR
jgi:hypothetical protein